MASLGHTRASSLLDNRQHSMASNRGFSLPPGQGGRNGAVPRPGGGALPHVEDILAVPRDIDSNQSIKRLMEMAETSLKQAEMSRDFNRPALALKDYVRASIIAVEVIRNHRDYATLKGERDELARMHNALLKRISQQDSSFAMIKRDIVADNKRTGVQPTVQRSGPSQRNGVDSRSMSPSKPSGRESVNGSPSPSLSSPPNKRKPAVQPKPQSLHGNAIKPTPGNGTSNAAQDLASRFANLRGPQSSPGQDPRIKTHQILPPKPKGPREMPPSQKPKISIDSGVPTLPKMPDAIYSPARGSVSSDSGRLPQSTPRGMYHRTGSSASVNGTPAATTSTQNDYFVPTQSYSNNSIPPVPPGNTMKIPEGRLITPDELFQAMKCKGSILIIDIRVREDFNEGHIMSSSTICIEPSILLREQLSADEISESLVLSPNSEQAFFEQRDEYDLVVLYDQDSEQVPKTPRNSDDLAMVSINRALIDFNYGKELKNSPKVLKGGIDAWIDLMGPASLQSTAAAGTGVPQLNRNRNYKVDISKRGSKFVVEPMMPPDQVKAWQETLKMDNQETASPNFVRTREEFLRRYPDVGSEQQSMTSPVQANDKPAYGLSHKVDLYTDLPSPPTRPAPALPRPSYTGISQRTEEGDAYEDNAPLTRQTTASRVLSKALERQPTGDNTKFCTGLNNPRNWCYANSTLQSLLGSPDFGRELANSEWVNKYKVPRKDDEKIDHPQLLIRIISNLFHWMSTGKFQVMKAQTLMNYSRHLCKQSNSGDIEFGGDNQQDAQEFMSFLFTHLHDETNARRDRHGQVAQPDTKNQSLLNAAAEYWRNYLDYNQSVIDRFWRGIEVSSVECQDCHTTTYQFSTFDCLPVTVDIGRGPMSLHQVLEKHTSNNTVQGFDCTRCRPKSTNATQSLSLARMPSLLCVAFRRFGYGSTKINAPITWDFNDFDFSPYFLKPKDRADAPGATDRAFAGSFHYECYAVIVHSGTSINSGHYKAYVRDSSSHDQYAWYFCDDSRVEKIRIGSGDRDDKQEQVFKSGRDDVPYLVFFRRKDMR